MSRTLVVSVYEQLVAEGYVESRIGAGTFVVHEMLEPPFGPEGLAAALPATPPARPTPAIRYARLKPDYTQFEILPFNLGRCTVDDRTLTIWRRLTAAQLRKVDPTWLGYADPRGSLRLRRRWRSTSAPHAACNATQRRSWSYPVSNRLSTLF